LNAIVEFLVKENENKKLKISLLQEKIIETEKKNIFLENKLSTLNRDIFMDINNIEKKQKENIQNFEKNQKKYDAKIKTMDEIANTHTKKYSKFRK